MADREQLVARISAAAERARGLAARVEEAIDAGTRADDGLVDAHERVAAAESASLGQIATMRALLDATSADLASTLARTDEQLTAAAPRLLAMQQVVSTENARAAVGDLVDAITQQLPPLREAMGGASEAVEAASSSGEIGTSRAAEALAELLDGLEQSSGAVEGGVGDLAASLQASAALLQASADETQGELDRERDGFNGFVTQTLHFSIRSRVDAVARSSTSHVEEQLRARAADGVRLLVEALMTAAQSLRDGGAEMSVHRQEASDKFGRIGDSVATAAPRADHVISEADRVRQEQEESGGESEDV